MKVDFYRHNLDQKDIDEVTEVLKSVFLTTGEWTKRFEDKFAAYVGAPYAVGLSSATAGLELALHHYGIKSGDEVITTPMSFIATANAIEVTGAKPVFVDVEERTGNINADLIEAAITDKTRAIMPVHLYGQMCDMKKIRVMADKHNLKIIEDAAHCIEGERDGVKVGELADVACFSFYATKNITSGEGGALTCHDPKSYEWFIKARSHGMNKDAADRYTKVYQHYDISFLGYKCNMSNISAALLINQIDRMDMLLALRQEIANRYDEAFKDHSQISYPQALENSRHSRHLYTIWTSPEKRDEHLHALQKDGVGVAVNYRPIHLMQYYREKYGYKPGDFPVCEKIGNSTITIPLYPKLTKDQIDYVIERVNQL